MYKSPIEILTTDIQTQIVKQQEEKIYQAVVHCIPNIDKEELIRALKYDRQQYNIGYMEGKRDAIGWIPVTERLPEIETEVLILARHGNRNVITTGMYEDGRMNTEDSDWWWETDGFEYDEELDVHIIPEGWWEYKHYIDDETRNYAIDGVVTHWMPLPEPPKDISE